MNLICIVCPNGCTLSVNQIEGEVIVTGARCPRGKKYAITELTAPTRSLTSTVKTVFPEKPVLSVRTDGELPKSRIFEAMKIINSVTLDKKVKRGEVVIANVLDSGVDIIATGEIE